MSQQLVEVIVARNIKRYGKELKKGVRIQIPQEELERAPAGIYARPGEAIDPAEQQRQAQERQALADRSEKHRRIDADRVRREQEAQRLVEWTRQQEQLAAAGAARIKKERLDRAGVLSEPPAPPAAAPGLVETKPSSDEPPPQSAYVPFGPPPQASPEPLPAPAAALGPAPGAPTAAAAELPAATSEPGKSRSRLRSGA